MNKLKLAGLTLTAAGLLAIAGSIMWREAAVPALVRYPTDLDVTPAYEGTVTIFVDPATHAPLAEPKEYPLTVHSHVEVLADGSSKERVVVHETLTLAAAGLFPSTVQEHQYVMDRRRMVNVDDPRAWAFTADNPVNRAGSYRLQFPFDADAPTYPVYKNETGSINTADQTASDRASGSIDGVNGTTVNDGDLTAYETRAEPKPITDAYRTALTPIVALPDSLTIDQIRPILTHAGIDLDATLAALVSVADPDDVKTLIGLAAAPIRITYSDGFTGTDLIEPDTGSIVAVHNVTETIYATPDPAVTKQLQAILAKYPQVPEAASAASVIATGQLDLIPMVTYEYHQTPASITNIWNEIKNYKDQRNFAESSLPWGLLVAGVVLDIGGTLMVAIASQRHRRGPTAPAAHPRDTGDN